MKNVVRNRTCRMCKSVRLTKILAFGPQPLANAFLKKSQLNKYEPFYPLDVYFCQVCHLVQLRDIVAPEVLFKDYVYVSSTSPVFIKHFQEYADEIILRFNLNSEALVIDIGSNDGILLKPFAKRNIRTLGIEPAKNIAEVARKNGIYTISEFFNGTLARKIRDKYGPAMVIAANNVFAHINNVDEVVKGVSILLDKDGVFIIEAPYLVDFLEKNLFDTVYHEHLSYLSLTPLVAFFARRQMRVFDAQQTDVHGGSFKVYVTSTNAVYPNSPHIKQLLQLEEKHKLHHLITYQEFAKRVQKNKLSLLEVLNNLRASGKRIAGYGAPAKGNTLLNYFGITAKILDFIVDDSPLKQGLYTPGTHIEVVSPQKLNADHPDYILILAWNFAVPIMEKLKEFKQSGGKFIIPVPNPAIL